MKFSELDLIEPILNALNKKGYTVPTPIQEKSIPAILSGKDIFGNAQTGTGKTASFALPILQMLHLDPNKSGPRNAKALILAPTRELALQISENIREYGAQLRIKHAVVFGGVSQNPQVNAIRNGVDIIIATPGRLLDLMNQGHVRLSSIKFLVLDEADRMLDMGFINDIKKVLKMVPEKRQTLFFSATASKEIMVLANTILKDPIHIAVNPVASAAPIIKQSVYFVAKEDKKQLLNHILKNEKIPQVLIFTRTKHGADKVVKELVKNGIKADAIHGNKSQGARERVLRGFKDRSLRVLVATDIASRGIDVDKLSHVINYEIPEQAETYVHRIGRTGRAGAEGSAMSFCSRDEMSYFRDITKLIKKNIEAVTDHPFAK